MLDRLRIILVCSFVMFHYRDQLTVCISEILATDVPEKWQSIVLKVNGYLISEDQETLLGALLAFCQIVKEYQ